MAAVGKAGPFAVRSADALVAETREEHHTLKRSIGPFDLTAIGVGSIIGTGIFVIIGAGVGDAGPAVLLAFAIAALTAGFSALSYAELASAIPVSGSAYTYSYATLGEIVAWIIGWDLILEYGVSVAAVAVSWGGNLNAFLDTTFGFTLPDAITNAPEDGGIFNVPAVLITLAVTALLIIGVRESTRANRYMVLFKIGVLLFFAAVAVTVFNSDRLTPFSPHGADGVNTAATAIFFAYIGFDTASTASEEVRNPKRNIPIGILGALVVTTVIYMLVAVTALGALPAAQLTGSDAPLAAALDKGAGISWAGSLMALGALVAITSVILTVLYGQTRIFFSMSRDGLLPERLADVSPRTGTPVLLTLIFGVFISALAAVVPLEKIIELVNVGTLSAFILVNIGVIILRRTRPDMARPFRVPLSPIFPLIGVGLCIYLLRDLPTATWVRFVVWLAVGVLIYAFYGFRNSRLRREL
jgi:APA family basic amino acid/polyamine antiporter